MEAQVPQGELRSFYDFLGQQLTNSGPDRSPEELLQIWRAKRREYAESVAAIQEGLEDVKAGRVQDFDEFDREFRQRHDLPPQQA